MSGGDWRFRAQLPSSTLLPCASVKSGFLIGMNAYYAFCVTRSRVRDDRSELAVIAVEICVRATCGLACCFLTRCFIDEVIAEFMFWKLLRTLEILLEAFDPYVARTPNMEIMYMLAVSRTKAKL